MYKEYFGFEEMPFSIAPDPRYLYMSEQHREALAHLLYGFNSDGGFVLLTGDIGTGKTTVCRCLLEQIPENSAIAFIINPKLTVAELLATICDEFGIRYPEGNTSIKVFVDMMNTFLLDANARGYKCLLIIDEAQNLSADVLEQLRLLTNLETSQRKLLQIILLGQPELREKLSKPELRQLAQRVIARFHLGPLSKKEVAAYIAHRLSIARIQRGAQRELFPASAMNTIYRFSKGVPRLINVLCDRALLGAFVQDKNHIDKSTLKKAAREVIGETEYHGNHRKLSAGLIAALIFIAFATVIAAYYSHNKKNQDITSQDAVKKNVRMSGQGIVSNSINIPEPHKLKESPGISALHWPADKPNHLSDDMAFQALFEKWGITYQPEANASACEQAQTYGLRCLNSVGSMSDLRRINKPVILKLYESPGKEFYAVLTSFKDQEATLSVGSENRKVAVKDIEVKWHGEYTLLWRTPPNYRGFIHPGDSSPVVRWLDKQLSLIHGRIPLAGENPVYDNGLVRQVKTFQFAEGLVPDGIVGTQTIIHLNAVIDKKEPILSDRKADGRIATSLRSEVK